MTNKKERKKKLKFIMCKLQFPLRFLQIHVGLDLVAAVQKQHLWRNSVVLFSHLASAESSVLFIAEKSNELHYSSLHDKITWQIYIN